MKEQFTRERVISGLLLLVFIMYSSQTVSAYKEYKSGIIEYYKYNCGDYWALNSNGRIISKSSPSKVYSYYGMANLSDMNGNVFDIISESGAYSSHRGPDYYNVFMVDGIPIVSYSELVNGGGNGCYNDTALQLKITFPKKTADVRQWVFEKVCGCMPPPGEELQKHHKSFCLANQNYLTQVNSRWGFSIYGPIAHCYTTNQHPVACEKVGGAWIGGTGDNKCCGDDPGEHWDNALRVCCNDAQWNKLPGDESCCDPDAKSGKFMCKQADECSSCTAKGPCYCPGGCKKDADTFVARGENCGELAVCSSCTAKGPCRCPSGCLREEGTAINEYTTCGGGKYPVKFTYSYDPAGRVSSIRTALGKVRRFIYNNIGWMLSLYDPNTGKRWLSYDDLGRTVAVKDNLGFVTHTHYDIVGRVNESWIAKS